MNSSTSVSELLKTHQAGQERFIYFLLAAAGAAVAFASQKTEGQVLSWWLLPLGLAVLAWAASFYFGCKAVTWSHTTIRQEIYLNQTREREAGSAGTRRYAELIDTHLKSLDAATSKWSLYYQWQFRLLVGGGVLYCLWRLTELVRTVPLPQPIGTTP